VPYERAMERMFERAEESAAPIVPEERANAAVDQSLSDYGRHSCGLSDGPEVLRPKLGPDI
jgi:hypothetical protein